MIERSIGRRALAIRLAGVACLVVAAAIAANNGYPPVVADLRPGMAWMASNEIGELTLVDGVSAAPAAGLHIATPRSRLSVVQAGANVYAVDQNDGTVTAIDGATHRKEASVRLHDVGSTAKAQPPVRFEVAVAGRVLYEADRATGELVAVDAGTLVPIANPLSATMNSKWILAGDARLWMLNELPSGLTSYDERLRPLTPRLDVVPYSELLLVGGNPVVVDRNSGRASTVDSSTGTIRASITIAAAQSAVFAGSSRPGRVLVVRPSAGEFAVCVVGETTCRPPVYLSSGLEWVGAPIETGGHVLVQELRGGAVWIINLERMAVVKRAVLFPRPVPFELIVRDGIVFFNDPESERAGVLRLDGTVVPIRKYDKTTPRPVSAPASRPRPTASLKSATASGVSPSGPRGTESGRATTPAPTPTGPGGGPGLGGIEVAPRTPEVGQEVHFSANATGQLPITWNWTIRRPDDSVEATGTGAELVHTFSQPGVYRITVQIWNAVGTDQRSLDLTVMAAMPQLRCGEVITTSRVLKADLTCPGDGLIIGASDIVLDLNGHTLKGSGGGSGIVSDFAWRSTVMRDGTIAGFGNGIWIRRSVQFGIINVRLNENDVDLFTNAADGLTIEGGHVANGRFTMEATEGARIVGTTFAGSYVLVSDDSNDMEVVNNTFVDSTIHFSECNRPLIANNQVKGSIQIFFTEGSIVRDNDVEGYISLMLFRESPGTLVAGNHVTGHEATVRSAGIYIELINNSGAGLVIRNNSLADHDAAGIYLTYQPGSGPLGGGITISDNTVSNNGRRSTVRDRSGRPVDDGIHIDAPAGSTIVLSRNHSSGNHDYGIEAQPGSVTDGGGNTSTGDPNRCIGVVC